LGHNQAQPRVVVVLRLPHKKQMPTSEHEVRDKVVLDRRPKGRQRWHHRGLLEAALAGVAAEPEEDKERGHDLERSALASGG
jgi:hypothetical protein